MHAAAGHLHGNHSPHSLEQALQDLSVHELCMAMTAQKLEYCASAFKKERVDGAELVECSMEEFIAIIVSGAGVITDIMLASTQLIQYTRP